MSTDLAITSAPSGDDIDTRNQIRILTTVLNGLCPRGSDSEVSQHDISSATKTFVHLAQLLDHSPLRPIAVTGYMGYPTSHIVLVDPNSAKDVPGPAHLDTLWPRAVPASDWVETRTPNLIDTRSLAETLLWVLRTLGSASDRKVFLTRAGRWFLRARWSRYCARIKETMNREWETSPIDSMMTWKPRPTDADILGKFDRQELRRDIRDLHNFKHFDHRIDGSALFVVFRIEQAALWVQAISEILHFCCTAISDTNTPADGQPPGFKTSAALLPVLLSLLHFHPVKVIFTKTSLGNMFLRRQSIDDADVDNVPAERLDELVDDELDPEDEDAHHTQRGGLLVFRFLKTIVAPYRALAHLTNRASVLVKDVQVTLIRLAPPRDDEQCFEPGAVQKVRADLDKMVGDRSQGFALEDTRQWIEARFASVDVETARFRENVHAEAGLMALSYMEFEPGLTGEKGTALSIGVSKKCCWMCWKLGLLLQSDDPGRKFELPGSHGTIYSWNPPEFGVPNDILRRLYDEAVEIAVTMFPNRKSSASSPTSDSTMLSDVDFQSEEDHDYTVHKVGQKSTVKSLAVH